MTSPLSIATPNPSRPAPTKPRAVPDLPLLCTINDGVARLTLNRPRQYNALSDGLLEALMSTLGDIARNDAVRVVVLGASGRAFCAGHDLKEMRAHDDHAHQHALFTQCSAVMSALVALPQPVIARVQGLATAAGCQLVASCDLAVAATEAQFAVSGVRVGLFCSTPAVALSRNIPRKRAMELLLTGDFIDAATALEYGLINRVAAQHELDATVDELAESIASKPPRVIRLGKRNFYRQLEQDLGTAYTTATDAIADNMMLEETREGIDAFIEKRPPRWER